MSADAGLVACRALDAADSGDASATESAVADIAPSPGHRRRFERIPPELNLVRITGLLGPARTPKGFHREHQLPGDHQKYFARDGYRLEPCPAGHGFETGCKRCLPYHGAIAVPTQRACDLSDRAVRTELSAARGAGLLGAKGAR